MYEVNDIIAEAVKSRGQALVFDPVNVKVRYCAIPFNGVTMSNETVSWRSRKVLGMTSALTRPSGRRRPGKAQRWEAS